LKTVDLITSWDSALWSRCIEQIAMGDDPLKENYLNINFDEFLSFPAVVVEDEIVCFSGLQTSSRKWGTGVARASSRMWIHPAYRHTGISKFAGGDKFLNTTYCLPIQFATALNSDIDVLFISRENNPRAFAQYLKLVNINCGRLFTLQDHRYNVCGPLTLVPESCSQYVAVHSLNSTGAATWQNNMLRYQLTDCKI
jgi:hypothetical protein